MREGAPIADETRIYATRSGAQDCAKRLCCCVAAHVRAQVPGSAANSHHDSRGAPIQYVLRPDPEHAHPSWSSRLQPCSFRVALGGFLVLSRWTVRLKVPTLLSPQKNADGRDWENAARRSACANCACSWRRLRRSHLMPSSIARVKRIMVAVSVRYTFLGI